MPDKFEDLIAEMEDAGVDPAFIARTQAVFDASPLRTELKQAKADAQAAIDRATKAETATLSSTFADLGIKAKPTAFNLPADLDRLDRDAVSAWAVDQGLIDPPPPNVPPDQLDAMDRIGNASAGAGTTSSDPLAHLLAADDAAEFWKAADAAGVVTP